MFLPLSSSDNGALQLGSSTSLRLRVDSLGRLAGLVADAPLYRIEEAVNASEVFREGLLARLDDPEPEDLDAAHLDVYRKMPQPKLKRPPRNKLDRRLLPPGRHRLSKGRRGGSPARRDDGEELRHPSRHDQSLDRRGS